MTMNENNTITIRKEIMRRFVRTLVWIDDEIRPDQIDYRGNPFRSFFYPTAQEFQKKGILIHLHPYPSDPEVDQGDTFSSFTTASFDSALKLAKSADIILLDWHLGRKNPRNSIALLKRLNEDPAIRHVVVLSEYADKFADEMRDDNMLTTGGTDSNDLNLFQQKGDAWVNGLGTHIIVMNKQDLSSISADGFCNAIVDSIFNLMSTASPDYLHWTAFEIAGKLRHTIPHWIQAIPCGADAAVISELISDKTEARDFIPENLLEDLSHIAKLQALDSLNAQNCQSKPYEIQTEANEDPRHKKFVHFLRGALVVDADGKHSSISAKDIKSMRKENNVDIDACNKFMYSQQIFSEFCEHISKPPGDSPTFGAIYAVGESVSDASPQDPQQIYLCLSQECDAVRENNLIMLKGTIQNATSAKEGTTKLSFHKSVFGFLPEANSIQAAEVIERDGKRQLNGFMKIGQLRKATARRILNRYWNYLSRSAVNLPTFARVDRDEK
jgi:CheY-like chemotaxis protein